MRGRGILLRAHGASTGTAHVPQLNRKTCLLAILLFAAFLSVERGPNPLGTTARADDAWAVDRDGIWDDPANWQNGTVPDGVGVRALFGPVLTAPRFIRVQDLPGGGGNGDNRVTLGDITFDSPIGYSLTSNAGGSGQLPRIQFDTGAGSAPGQRRGGSLAK